MPLAELIWTTSRADESTISATGANIVARAIVASDWFRERLAEAWDDGNGYLDGTPNPYRD